MKTTMDDKLLWLGVRDLIVESARRDVVPTDPASVETVTGGYWPAGRA